MHFISCIILMCHADCAASQWKAAFQYMHVPIWPTHKDTHGISKLIKMYLSKLNPWEVTMYTYLYNVCSIHLQQINKTEA